VSNSRGKGLSNDNDEIYHGQGHRVDRPLIL
jgi:hypothetical protein